MEVVYEDTHKCRIGTPSRKKGKSPDSLGREGSLTCTFGSGGGYQWTGIHRENRDLGQELEKPNNQVISPNQIGS